MHCGSQLLYSYLYTFRSVLRVSTNFGSTGSVKSDVHKRITLNMQYVSGLKRAFGSGKKFGSLDFNKWGCGNQRTDCVFAKTSIREVLAIRSP